MRESTKTTIYVEHRQHQRPRAPAPPRLRPRSQAITPPAPHAAPPLELGLGDVARVREPARVLKAAGGEHRGDEGHVKVLFRHRSSPWKIGPAAPRRKSN
jgi:hypothetical protein